ncbi:hypothetical protein NDU88_002369 [Pleurodeles waltl]|uniref:Uncharacterized protein n=1 Tax=Pleurodeles waltl TaxID=8319 RepID=A0AAV7M280_PLEWA|nr:hypothetical protein NDU88_002369 [Pleurodeles waltl]
MPRGKTTGKTSGKPARQLLFSKALRQQKHPPHRGPPTPCTNMTDDTKGASMDRILQEISAVGRKLEGMDNAMVALTAETRSMRLEIAGFQSQISGLDHRTAEQRRAFLSLHPRLHHLDVKFGLFELARIWITKNGESRTFYDPEDLRTFLEGLHDQTQSMETTVQTPQDTRAYPREPAIQKLYWILTDEQPWIPKPGEET